MNPMLLSGQPDPAPEQIPLRAGPLSAVYERGDLRYVCLADREIVRRIYVAVRDANWGTVPAVISGESIERDEVSFTVRYTATHREGPIHFRWEAAITGGADGSLSFIMEGRALSAFRRNRLGFCVLHPMEMAGQAAEVGHDDGTVTLGEFPVRISPHQPFKSMRSIRAGEVEMTFEGEVFEMEDQRNWTDAFFAELNRNRPETRHLDALVFSINPQVHAFDNPSLVENLAAQQAAVESARAFSDGRKVLVSPVTFRMRWNPNATAPEPLVPPGELPPQVDPRQLSLFGAGWTLGSLKYLALGRASSLTYFETTGFGGVMERSSGSPLPGRFPSRPGQVYPLFHVLAGVRELAGGELVETLSSRPLEVEGLLLRRGEARRWLIAGYAPEPQTVRVRGLPRRGVVRILQPTGEIKELELDTPEGEVEIELGPYEVRQIDSRGE